MYPQDKKAIAWLQEANRLPSRNQVPPGRLPANSVLMTRKTNVNHEAADIQEPNQSAVSNVDSSAECPQPRGQVTADSTKHTADIAADTQFFAAGAASSKDAKSLQNKAVQVLQSGALASSNACAEKSPLPASKENVPVSRDEKNHQNVKVGLADAQRLEIIPLTAAVLDQVAPPEKALHPGKAKRSHTTWEVSSEGGNGNALSDVRNVIAPEHKLQKNCGRILKDPWYGEGDDDTIFLSDDFCHQFISHWRSQVPRCPAVDMTEDNVDDHKDRDIDTYSGEYVASYKHEDTVRDEQEHQRTPRNLQAHRDTWTSNTLIERERALREKFAHKKPTHMSGAQVADAQHAKFVTETLKRPEPEIDCVLRPAATADIPGVVELYNLEVKHGIRAWDTKLLDEKDFHKIGSVCFHGKLPFIVAVKRPVDLTDPTQWPSRGAYEEYMRYQASKPKDEDQGKHAKETVLGFAFCRAYGSGFGTGKHAGRYAVQLSLYVHPEYRRKRVGHALLDRTMNHMSWFSPANTIEHTWECDGRAPYNEPDMRHHLERPLPKFIIAEALFRGHDDPDLEWMRRFLGRFEFQERGYLHGVHCTQRGSSRSEWLDKYVWQHEAQRGRAVTDSDPGLDKKPGDGN